MTMQRLIHLLSLFLFATFCADLEQPTKVQKQVIVGAERINAYLPTLRNKRVALTVNHTSMLGNQHLVDTLLAKGIQISKIFAPEHGFRGKADAGEKVDNQQDPQTKLPIISLYGKNKKPSKKQLANVDIVVFDIQDVGVRFYTYISTMHYLMEACASAKIPFMVLDRPNPNGFYVDGPVLDTALRSFVGMHPIPIVHGLTVAELAQMINGENWLSDNMQLDLCIIPCLNYTHSVRYSVPVKPSPNLPNDRAIYLYPSLCLFEGTNISVGRGTKKPFQIIGAPGYENYTFTFIPQSMPGAKHPKHKKKICFGKDLSGNNSYKYHFFLQELIDFYQKAPDREVFFNDFFEKLAGNRTLRKKIEQQLSEETIRESWLPRLANYKKIRKLYLLYEDFE